MKAERKGKERKSRRVEKENKKEKCGNKKKGKEMRGEGEVKIRGEAGEGRK